jgi:hypothetical protein
MEAKTSFEGFNFTCNVEEERKPRVWEDRERQGAYRVHEEGMLSSISTQISTARVATAE